MWMTKHTATAMLMLALLALAALLPRSTSAQSVLTQHRYTAADAYTNDGGATWILPDTISDCDHTMTGMPVPGGFRVAGFEFNTDCGGMYSHMFGFSVDEYSYYQQIISAHEAQGGPADAVWGVSRRQGNELVLNVFNPGAVEQIAIPDGGRHTLAVNLDSGIYILDGGQATAFSPYPSWGDPIPWLGGYVILHDLAISDDSMGPADMLDEMAGWATPPPEPTAITVTAFDAAPDSLDAQGYAWLAGMVAGIGLLFVAVSLLRN